MSLSSCSITVYHVVDITGTQWYFKLQAASEPPPVAPTAEYPEDWVTEEPEYAEDDEERKLYVIQKTTYSDGSYEYSGVSLSSAYEAAKAAMAEARAAEEEAKKVAVNYISMDDTGVMVADLTDGNQTPSEATGTNVLIDNESVKMRDGQKDLATYAGNGIRFDEGTPYRIGNDHAFIDYVDTDDDGEADTLRIVADSVSFRSGADVQDELTRLADNVDSVQAETDSLRADTEGSINALSGAIEQQNEAISAAQENTNQVRRFININPAVPSISVGTNDNTYVDIQAGRMAFVADGNEAASVGSSDMKIPTVTTTTLNMQATDPETGNIVGDMFWVMRSNGHLSLKMSG